MITNFEESYRIVDNFQSFGQRQNGSVSILFGVSMIPLIGMIGLA